MLEELESIRIYDEIKETNDEAVPFEDAVIAIENKRKWIILFTSSKEHKR